MSIVEANGSLSPGLPPKALASLQALATGNGQPEVEIVQSIAEWFVEQEDERAEGPLIDAVTWYLENYTL
jgi:hypothetical protein